jgi:hypothetical protein
MLVVKNRYEFLERRRRKVERRGRRNDLQMEHWLAICRSDSHTADLSGRAYDTSDAYMRDKGRSDVLFIVSNPGVHVHVGRRRPDHRTRQPKRGLHQTQAALGKGSTGSRESAARWHCSQPCLVEPRPAPNG